jgi:hypothetical protein
MKVEWTIIIPDPHKMYAITSEAIYPVKDLSTDAPIRPLSSSAGDKNSLPPSLRFVVRDLFNKRLYYMPAGIGRDEAEQVSGIQAGHKLLFPNSNICPRERLSSPTIERDTLYG